MKNIFTKVLMGIAIIASSLLPLNVAAAGSASFSLSPSTGSVANGNQFTVSVYENGDAVNVITAKLDYDASKVQFNGMSCAGSFTRVNEANGATCYTSPGTTVSGSQLVGIATFKVLTGSGSAVISMNAGSKIVGGNPATDMWNHAPTATSVTLTTPVTPPANNPPANNPPANNPQPTQNNPNSAVNTTKNPSASKTTATGTNNTANQTAANGENTNSATNPAGSDEAKKDTTPASNLAVAQKNVSVSLLWPIIAGILVIVIGAGAIYARRHPRQLAAAATAAALVAGSAKNAALAVFKKTETKPVAKKAAVVKKSSTKKAAPKKKTPTKKPKTTKKP